MSPRNDTFLSLCLAQAELSPLHYRHGSIIVRGGKVIGQGYNAFRPGFDGGALKTGILPASAVDGPAIQDLKQRLKFKSKPKSKSKSKPHHQQQQNLQDAGTFAPFESMAKGRNANTPLSMHSEMMAIRSALSLSSGTLSSQTSARAAAYYQKPCFKLPGDSKKSRARARGLKAYAEAVCAEASSTNTSTGKVSGGKYSVQTQSFEPRTSQPGGQVQCPQSQHVLRCEGGGGRLVEGEEKYCETPEREEV
jgi:deoxycytidylate deaminase